MESFYEATVSKFKEQNGPIIKSANDGSLSIQKPKDEKSIENEKQKFIDDRAAREKSPREKNMREPWIKSRCLHENKAGRGIGRNTYRDPIAEVQE
ncbi:unnamed protein product [Schistosoma margrebowiei]|uniref:Uncharacterized protein n=1 Tax=Schistosoma margrebowiei TaxID=48269 RepID=A0A183MQS4_9TREM|nr:unnamed protein product [Schistosoma margrebowiei]